jgi:hypothetical protein
MIPMFFLPPKGQKIQKLRVAQTIVVMDEPRVDVYSAKDSLPEIHRVNPETDSSDAALFLEIAKRIEAFTQSPLRVLSALVFNVVEYRRRGMVFNAAPSTDSKRMPQNSAETLSIQSCQERCSPLTRSPVG